MSFISLQFAGFIVLLILLMYLIKDKKKQNILLLIASYIFYAFGDYRFLLILVAISSLMWFLGKKISTNRNRAKIYLVIGVVVDLLVLGVFKYFNFFVGSFANLLGMNYTSLKIILPLGISFYMFQSISYLADIYKNKIEAETNILNVLLYVGFFPQITMGPIVKAHYFLPQLRERQRVSSTTISNGAQIFLLGLFKKVVIADRLGVCVDSVYSAPTEYSALSIAMAVVSYSIQIYCDFSGYSDMAIGVATALGFDLGINFNLPYIAKNVSDFWRRWHISLSSWFRDYVYIPLGGNRRGNFRTYYNLFITMLLSGLWHGASWLFVIWGLSYAVLSVVHKMYVGFMKKHFGDRKPLKVGVFLSVIVNYICVALLWIPFRSDSWGQVVNIFKGLFIGRSGIDYINVYSVVFIILITIVEIIAIVKNKWNNPIKPMNLTKLWPKVVIVCFVIVIIVFSYVGDTAFIYANF